MAAKALTWDEIVAMLNALPKDRQSELDTIFQHFFSATMSVVMLIRKLTKEEDEIIELERIKRIVNMCPKDELFIRAKDKIWNVRQQLLTENADYFLNKDYSAFIKKDHNQAFIECLMEIVKARYANTTDAEKGILFGKARVLIEQIEKFKNLVNEPK